MAEDAQGGLGDIDGLIADAFEIVIDAGHGEDEAQVDGHGLLEGEETLDAVIDLELNFIDGGFFLEDGFGERLFGIEHGVHGLMNGALGETAHPEQTLLQVFEFLIEMTFQGSAPSRNGR
jgi:hypothetical protein